MCNRAHPEPRRAFTLLEVIIATMIIGMLAVTLYRFVSAHLNAIRVSTELNDETEALQGAIRVLEMQLRDLKPQQLGTLRGQPLKFRGLSNDEITWRSTSGAGLLTSAAAGEYRVTLTVQPVDENARETELGLRRQLIDPAQGVDDALLKRGAGTDKYDWLPLIRPFAALEVRYFNPRLNDWQDTWNDPTGPPSLVRIRLWKYANSPVVEALLPVPLAQLRQ